MNVYYIRCQNQSFLKHERINPHEISRFLELELELSQHACPPHTAYIKEKKKERNLLLHTGTFKQNTYH